MAAGNKAGRAASKKSRAAARKKLPLRAAARKKSVLVPKPRVRIKPKIADLPPERQTEVRRQNQINTAKNRAKGGKVLKLKENKRECDRYVTGTVIVSIVETETCRGDCRIPPRFFTVPAYFVACLYHPLQPRVNNLLKGGILAWRSETSCSIVNNKALLSIVRLMEQEVPRSKLIQLNLINKKEDERFQVTIAAFEETGKCLSFAEFKSTDKRLWLSKKEALYLKCQIEEDYQQATGIDMAQQQLYITEVTLVFGGSTPQAIHNDDKTEDIPDFNQRNSIVAESGTIVYGIKEEKHNRLKIKFAKNNERDSLQLVNVYSGMAVFFAGWVYHAGADHGGRNESTRMYVDFARKK